MHFFPFEMAIFSISNGKMIFICKCKKIVYHYLSCQRFLSQEVLTFFLHLQMVKILAISNGENLTFEKYLVLYLSQILYDFQILLQKANDHHFAQKWVCNCAPCAPSFDAPL